MDIEDKLKEMGLSLPEVPKPVAEYIPAKVAGNLVFTSGQGPVKDGKFIYVGKVGKEISIEKGYEAAKMSALNCLAAIKTAIGSLDRVEEIVSLRGFVYCDSDFYRQPEVINGASELLVKIFGDRGKHARCALGVSSLPFHTSVELEMVVRIK